MTRETPSTVLRRLVAVVACALPATAGVCGHAAAAYLTGEYWPLADGGFRYSVTVSNCPPENNYSIYYVSMGGESWEGQVYDPAQPPGWTFRFRGGGWEWAIERGQWDAMVAPGESLGGFAFTSPIQGTHALYAIFALNPDDLRDRRHWLGEVEFELIPEPGLGIPLAVAVLTMGWILRRPFH